MTLVLVLVLEVSQVVSVDPLAMAILGLMVGCDVNYAVLSMNTPAAAVRCLSLKMHDALRTSLSLILFFVSQDKG